MLCILLAAATSPPPSPSPSSSSACLLFFFENSLALFLAFCCFLTLLFAVFCAFYCCKVLCAVFNVPYFVCVPLHVCVCVCECVACVCACVLEQAFCNTCNRNAGTQSLLPFLQLFMPLCRVLTLWHTHTHQSMPLCVCECACY